MHYPLDTPAKICTMPHMQITEDEMIRRGENLAQILCLKKVGVFYRTEWGDKTALGLYLTVKRIMEDDDV